MIEFRECPSCRKEEIMRIVRSLDGIIFIHDEYKVNVEMRFYGKTICDTVSTFFSPSNLKNVDEAFYEVLTTKKSMLKITYLMDNNIIYFNSPQDHNDIFIITMPDEENDRLFAFNMSREQMVELRLALRSTWDKDAMDYIMRREKEWKEKR